MNQKHGFNYFRKMWHLLGIIVPVAYYQDWFNNIGGTGWSTRIVLTAILGGGVALVFVVDVIRLLWKDFADFFWKYAGALMKQEEAGKFNATIPYLLSNLFVIYFFPPEISILSILFLIIGDPFAAWFGVFYGKKKLFNGKSLIGILAFLVSSLVAGVLVIYLLGMKGWFLGVPVGGFPDARLILILVAGALTAGVAEFFSGNALNGLWDDNFNIPFFSSIVMGGFAVQLLDIPWSGIFLF